MIPEKNGQIHRYRLGSQTFNFHLVFCPCFFYRTDSQVGIAIIIKPALPEPVQVFSGTIIHRVEKVEWCRMPAIPQFNIIMQTTKKSTVSQHIFYKEITKSRLGI